MNLSGRKCEKFGDSNCRRLTSLVAALFAGLGLFHTSNVSAKEKDKSSEKQTAAQLAKIDPAERAFFEKKIRPVLVKHCYECHSGKSDEIGGKLRVDNRNTMRIGGESGPVFVAGQPNKSLLISALRYEGLEMPPEKPLPEGVIKDFAQWIEMGAPDPRLEEKVTASLPEDISPDPELDESLWSFQPVQTPDVPTVQDTAWAKDPIDSFILGKIEDAGLTPSTDAPPELLLRRLYYDLIGLPPSLEQVKVFQSEYEQQPTSAVEHVVDELLASPHYGERWGRYWLDLARYGESNGNDSLSRNATLPHAWRYRDYVIAALNEDTPYDRFLMEQIAGDLLEAKSSNERDRLLIATGFMAMDNKPAKAMNVNFEMDVVEDQIDTVSTVVMGLSVACARCHDHKHDPIPTKDYYALAGIFLSTETLWGNAAFDPLTAPATPLHELKKAPKMPPFPEEIHLDPGAMEEIKRTKQQTIKANPNNEPRAMGVREHNKPVDCKINIKGESKQLGPSVPRGFLTASSYGEPISIPAKQSGRLQLVQWLTRGDHPQTSRVMVNRIWQHLFGEGLVRTPDDFGVYGERPTHPELLDHLALEFQSNGWSIKQMIRTIVLSRTYQLSSVAPAEVVQADPDNRLFARHNRRRLDAEAFRDSVLAVSGQLDLQPKVGSDVQHFDILVNKSGNLHQPNNHRSIYLCMLRHSEPPELSAFDLPDGTRPLGKRNITTLPTQSLFLINSPLLVAQSEHFAQRILSTPNMDPTARVNLLYQNALQRDPTTAELQRTLEFVTTTDQELTGQVPDAAERATQVWGAACQAIMATSEFRYID